MWHLVCVRVNHKGYRLFLIIKMLRSLLSYSIGQEER